MAPGKATDLELQDALIVLGEARLRHAVVTGQRQQALQALDAILQACEQKAQVVKDRLGVGKASERELLGATQALYETRLRLAIMRNQAEAALEAADGALRTQRQNVDDLRERVQIGKVPPEDLALATRRLEEWRALRRQQALVVKAQGYLKELTGRDGGQADPKAVEGARADLATARRQVYVLASLLMPAAGDLLAGAAAGRGPLTDQDASGATASAPAVPRSQAASAPPAAQNAAAAARRQDRQEYEAPRLPADSKVNLVVRDFPPRFADYNSMQGMPGPVILDPRPAFCKSNRPLLFDLTRHGVLPVKIILDQSGPGSAYDTFYMDFNGNDDFLDDPVYKASPFDGSGTSMDRLVRGHFRDVHIVRNRVHKVTAHVQVMIMAGPSWPTDPKACYLLFMAQKWAVGTVKLDGQEVPAALIDRTWNDSFIDAAGLNPAEHPNVFPRSDYLVLAIDGEDKILSTGRLLNEGGTAYGLLAKYLLLNSGLYEVKTEQTAEGVRLELLPAAPLPMGELEFADVSRRLDPLMMIGINTCVLLKKPGQTVRVPADTYYVPASMNMPGGDALVTVDAEEAAGQGDETPPIPSQQTASAVQAPAAPQANASQAGGSQATEAGEALTGIVRGPDGEPLADVQVILCPKNQSVYLLNDESQNKGHTIIASQQDGWLVIPVDGKVGALLASHEKGIATVSVAEFARSRTIRLQPWATVEGTVRVGGEAAPSAEVELHCQTIGMNVAWISIDYKVKADEQGRFRFDHVPPGLVQIGRMIDLYRTETRWFPGRCPGYYMNVLPGGTTQVQLGGTGRPVCGRATLAGWKGGDFNWGKSFVSLAIKQEMPSPPSDLDRHEQYEWRENWRQSEAGREYQLRLRWYNVPIGADGSFRIEDVPAGTYTLNVEAYSPNGEWMDPRMKVGSLAREVVVPAMATAWSDEPLELGELKLAASPSGSQADPGVTTRPAGNEQAGQGGSTGAGAATQPTASAPPKAEPVAAASQPAAATEAQNTGIPAGLESMLGERKPYKVPASQPGQRCNLVWRDFPPGFGDYFCIQGTPAPAVADPKPAFCKSDRPLLVHTPEGLITSAMLFDQSTSDGPYDTLYIDLSDNGDFLDDPVYHAQAYEGVGPDGGKVHSRFTNVQVMRNKAQDLRAHVQIFLREVTFNNREQPPFRISLIPQRWAVGTVRLKGRDVPAAVLDRTWNDDAVEKAGLNLHEYKDRYPRGDYLILEPAGGQELRPGPPMGSKRGDGSPRTILNEYLQIGEDTYKVNVAQFEEGVRLDLSSVQLPMGKVRVQFRAGDSRVIGLKTSVLLPGPAEQGEIITVPVDTYALLGHDAGFTGPAAVEPGQTVDLPKLSFRLKPEPPGKPVVGDPAPAFETTTLDGKSLKLADYRGRLVLLDFWAAWCEPCVAEIPNLRSLHERFGKDGRFTVISLSLDEDTDMVAAFQQKTAMPWTQCFLAEKERADITRKYGVNVLPARFLIGPDGKILAIGLRGRQIIEAVEKALAVSSKSATSPSR